jgi:hypothetical protein
MVLGVIGAIVLLIGFGIFWFFYSAPPTSVTMLSGPPESAFYSNAIRYRAILAASGVTLKLLPTSGAFENLIRLANPANHVDIGFYLGSMPKGMAVSNLVSLGTVYCEPMRLFYRGVKPITLISELKGKRLAVGAEGSGTRSFALNLLTLNDVALGSKGTTFSDLEGNAAAKALLANEIDAVFMMGDTASLTIIRELQRTADIRLYNFVQADAYVRRITHCQKLELPMGAVDFGKNIPPENVALIGPAVELIARKNLHPAIIALLIEAAQEIHGRPGLYRKRGEYPAPIEHDIAMSENAERFYKSGKSFFHRFYRSA